MSNVYYNPYTDITLHTEPLIHKGTLQWRFTVPIKQSNQTIRKKVLWLSTNQLNGEKKLVYTKEEWNALDKKQKRGERIEAAKRIQREYRPRQEAKETKKQKRQNMQINKSKRRLHHPIKERKKKDDVQLHFLGSVLIHPFTINEKPTSTDLGRWTAIFSYLHFNEYERLSVRTLCRLFRIVLPGPTCVGVYTIYPHPNHASLRSLMNRLNGLASVERERALKMQYEMDHAQPERNFEKAWNKWEKNRKKYVNKQKQSYKNVDFDNDGSKLPEHLFLANGIHEIELKYHKRYGKVVNQVYINFPISIIGESREHCIVMGGLKMNGKKEDDINVSNLTLHGSMWNGEYVGHSMVHLFIWIT